MLIHYTYALKTKQGVANSRSLPHSVYSQCREYRGLQCRFRHRTSSTLQALETETTESELSNTQPDCQDIVKTEREQRRIRLITDESRIQRRAEARIDRVI